MANDKVFPPPYVSCDPDEANKNYGESYRIHCLETVV